MKVLYVIAAASLIVGGVLSGKLLSAGAVTSTSNPAQLRASGASARLGSFEANEDPAHEKAESVAHEAAEDSGQLPPGGHKQAGRAARAQRPKSQAGSSAMPQANRSSQK
jgi:hypothetical protein